MTKHQTTKNASIKASMIDINGNPKTNYKFPPTNTYNSVVEIMHAFINITPERASSVR